MKKHNELAIIFLLILTLSFGTSTGCKPNPTPTKTKKVVISSNKLDLKGREIRFTNYQDGQRFENGAKMIDCYHFKTNPEYKYYAQKVKDIEENYNCSLIWGISTHETLLNSVLKGEPIADLSDFIQKEVLQILSLGEQSLIMPLDSYADILEINNPELWDQKAMDFYRFGGNTLVLSPIESWTDADSCTAMFFNKTMLVNKGLWNDYNLYEMQKDKTWTWDIFKDLCLKVTRDSDSDGKIDKFGINYDNLILNPLAISNGDGIDHSSLINLDKDNNAIFSFNKPSQRAAYDLIKELRDNGCINFESESRLEPFIKGNTLFFVGGGYSAQTFKELFNDELGVVAMPLGPDNKDKNYYTNRLYAATSTGVFKNVKNPSELIYVLKDYALSPIPQEAADSFEYEYLTKTLDLDESMLETFEIITQPEVGAYEYWEIWRNMPDFYEKIVKSFTDNYPTEKLFGKDSIDFQNKLTEYWDNVKVGLEANKTS